MAMLAVRGAGLLDGTGRDPVTNATVVVENGRIVDVLEGGAQNAPAGAQVIDTGGCMLMPGLMDLHVHLASPNILYYEDSGNARLTRSAPQILLYAVRYAQILLESGFTTVRDLDLVTPQGLAHEGIIALRDAIGRGVLPGPRLVVGGMTFITGSHFELVGWLRHLPRPPGFSADGADEMRKLARKHLREGVDVLKTCISGGTSTFEDEEPGTRHITREELDVLVDEAHAFGKMVATHCHTPDSVRMALDANVDTVEHCVYTDDDSVARMAKSGKYLVPTLAFRQRPTIESRRARRMPQFVIERMEEYLKVSSESFRRYYAAGVKFAMGTDTHVDPAFGDNAYELEVYCSLGMKPMEAILTATRNAADALGKLKSLGTLEPGKIADLIAVDGDPLSDIRVLQRRERIKLVLKNGQVAVDRRSDHARAGS
jgi:imidazolonepropionase-like amidohydrolase